MSSDEITQVRRELVTVSDKLNDLEAADFATKYQLSVESDRLRRQLSELTEDDSETLRGWAERSGRKPPDAPVTPTGAPSNHCLTQ